MLAKKLTSVSKIPLLYPHLKVGLSHSKEFIKNLLKIYHLHSRRLPEDHKVERASMPSSPLRFTYLMPRTLPEVEAIL